ncbi:MAG: signal peptidase I [Patescibacteria group bacterium]|nr:signal peptidase I [Patescibacteria group bacterium]MDE2116627.1 signal peptidase I [Patescibacteria group bacterium]
MSFETEQRPTVAPPAKNGSFWKELLGYALLALVIVVPIRLWVAQPFVVNGSSMDTTFKDGQYLVVDEISYRFYDPKRGDVLIFKYPLDTSKYFIKRLIGLPGETVIVKDGGVTIVNQDHPQGIKLDEPYVHSPTYGDMTVTLAPGEYFVMGDNRLVSSDSRAWGPVPRYDIIGEPVMRLLPLSQLGLWPGQVASSTMFDTLNSAKE